MRKTWCEKHLSATSYSVRLANGEACNAQKIEGHRHVICQSSGPITITMSEWKQWNVVSTLLRSYLEYNRTKCVILARICRLDAV